MNEGIQTSKWSNQAGEQRQKMSTRDEDCKVQQNYHLTTERDPWCAVVKNIMMPIVTPIVLQAEQATDAAGAHMSVDKVEMISRTAAKMTNSAVADELTSAEMRTLAKTATELFGASVSKFAINKFTSYSIDSSLFH